MTSGLAPWAESLRSWKVATPTLHRIHTYCLILSQAPDNCYYTLWIHTLDNNRHYTNKITTITMQQCKPKIVTKSNLTWVFHLFIQALVSSIQHFCVNNNIGCDHF